jgi:hypothetical protein
MTDLYFTKHCVFIDESGFNIKMRSSRAWSVRGKRVVSHSIIGCSTPIGLVNASIREPPKVPKIRKIQGGKKRKKRKAIAARRKDYSEGITNGHCMRFISETFDIMGK